jgi:hypothetical protein
MNEINFEGAAAWQPDSLCLADNAFDPRSRGESD